MRRLLLLACLGLWASVAQAQTLIQNTLTGSEAVLLQQGGPGGTGFFATTTALRDAADLALVGAGTTVTLTVSPNVKNLITTGAITTLNMSLPATPYNGQEVRLACAGGTITTLVISAYGGGTVNGLGATINPALTIVGANPTTCTANTVSQTALFTYAASTTVSPAVWYRIN